MNASIWMIEQYTGHQWEPVKEGDFATEDGADAALRRLVDFSEMDEDFLRVVEYCGDRADAYRS